MRYGRQSQGRGTGERSRQQRTTWSYVLWPLGIGLVLCALGLQSGLTNRQNQATFQANAVSAKAVIDQIYTSSLVVNPSGLARFDQYAIVQFESGGRTAHARVLLEQGCTGICFPVRRVGQVLTVYYSPENLSYAQLARPAHETSAHYFFWGFWLFGFFALVSLAIAAVNMVTMLRGALPATMPAA
jgi:hypothetical protein